MTKLLPAVIAAALLCAPAASLGADPKKAEPKADAKKVEPKSEAKQVDPKSAEAQAAMANMGPLGEAMQAAMAAPKGANDCESAYNGMKAMAEVLKAKMPQGQQKELPSKEKFVVSCKELPVEIQKCMSFGYAMEHAQQCQEAQAKLDPKALEKFKQIAK
ncbi:MAG: hypothetical protein HY901_31035 [Deltaproteobacteria bacterium]|nr:hypothetical protein [Deltaproteobacteria bacterium]